MLVSVMILTLAVTALLSVSAGAFSSVRYSKNKIVANWLAQESLDYIRNTRDTALIQNPDPATSDWWNTWMGATLGNPPTVEDISGGSGPCTKKGGCGGVFGGGTLLSGTKCFSAAGCYVDISSAGNIAGLPTGVNTCNGSCPKLQYDAATNQYSYSGGTASPFTVTIRATATSTDMIDITATVIWVDGSTTKSTKQSIILSNWQL